ncbi:AraC family transcriptional regulator [Rhizobium sp. C4]|uniref:AraC family transcriptional regulator n=1 Tax=Rhizobium sp. C4 TaxID=1349800 RepID=UPI001E2B8680|nr:AraC family transcriptional regulator [Rhizobium sp. C4]MCD2171834.1 helix-turn-helix domain-containing protein [Rhizobium sp. C4]
MNPLSTIPARLMHMMPGIASHYAIHQATPGEFRRFTIDQPSVILVKRGRKIVTAGSVTVTASPGECIFLPQGLECTIVNEVGVDNDYHAEGIVLSPELVASYSDERGSAQAAISPRRLKPEAGFLEAFARGRDTLMAKDLPEGIARHVVGEIVLWLRQSGIDAASKRGDQLVQRIRSLIGSDPAREWQAADIAQTVAMSQPSLRRKLAVSGTTLTDLVSDVRMQIALALLQASEMPVTSIAFEVGYKSPSKFAARFRARFGLAPTAIRVPSPQTERIGLETDRPGAAQAAE